ncbi:PTS glucose transporter subunit IIA [Nanchangia anserum]|uniref:PTS glucose transporter subunit IIA n=1 Tax=Nanchangia anserum TaxID=2692125 RepID=A0A8I0G9L6_9ACTO|nr:PTS glucose transporter subunit IIA [Nanchangia anserum]MBD3688738.1 PTS glucose transporter subunit IIA [Nanchangia anserum]QOX82480.1 PTS glucose transporter subunit IIA [Nanchangia anserum]
MFGWKKKTQPAGGDDLISPVDGQLIELAAVPDPLFSSGKLGPGFAVEPHGTTVAAPVAGEIMLVADTAHAFAITTQLGVEVLVHIGVDTVSLNGRGFHVVEGIRAGVRVSAGEAIVEIDLDTLRTQAPSSAVVVAVTNAAKGFDVSAPNLSAGPGEAVLTVREA